MFKAGIQKCKKWLKKPTSRRTGLFLVIFLMVLAVPAAAHADVVNWFLQVIAKLFELLTRLVGMILLLEVAGLVEVAQYSNFVAPGPTAVQVGWVVARDLANMFFILILLVIAFATIIGYEEYNLRSLLPRLLIMAVVINFSKTITGVIIDMGQVIMLTFVNGFKDSAGGNFLTAFQINKLLRLKGEGSMTSGGLVVGMMLAFIMVSISAMVVLIMLVTLIFRMVMLWVLVILSPIAFLLSTIPPGKEYYNRWWSELKKYVVYGPVVAFFLWLALLTAQMAGSDGIANKAGVTRDGGVTDQEISAARTAGSEGDIPTQAAESDVLISMVIFVSLLFAGLKIATETGGAVSNAVGGRVQRGAKGLVRFAGRQAVRPFAAGGRFAGRQAMRPVLAGRDAAAGRIGSRLAKITGGKIGGGVAVRAQRRKDHRLSARRAVGGSPAELAKISPTSFANEAGKSKGKDAQEFATAAAGNKAANDALQKDGGFEKLREKLDADSKNGDQGAVKALKGLNQANFDKVDEKDRMGVVRGMGDEAASAHVDEKNAAMFMENASMSQISSLQRNSTDKEVKSEIDKYVSGLDAETLDKKGAKVEDLPFGAMKNNDIAQWAFQNTANDPKTRRKMMQNPATASALQGAANSLIKEAGDDSQKVATLMADAINVGALTADKIESDESLQKASAHIDPKTLSKMVDARNPTQSAAGRAVMGHFQGAGSENAKRTERLRKTGNYGNIMPDSAGVSDDMVISQQTMAPPIPSDASTPVSDDMIVSEQATPEAESAANNDAYEELRQPLIARRASAQKKTWKLQDETKIARTSIAALKKSSAKAQGNKEQLAKYQAQTEKLEEKYQVMQQELAKSINEQYDAQEELDTLKGFKE